MLLSDTYFNRSYCVVKKVIVTAFKSKQYHTFCEVQLFTVSIIVHVCEKIKPIFVVFIIMSISLKEKYLSFN